MNLRYQEVATLSDTDLTELFCGKPKPNGKVDRLKEKFPYFTKELKRTRVTLQQLWREYLNEEPQGLQYSQLCYHYQQWRQDAKLSMHVEHKARDKLFVDYTGKSCISLTEKPESDSPLRSF